MRPEPRDYRDERPPERREHRDERPARTYDAPARPKPAKEFVRPAAPVTTTATAPTVAPTKAPASAQQSFKEKQSFAKIPAQRALVPKASRATPADQIRLWMSVGAEHGVATGDVVGAILGETGLPAQTIGTVDIRERHLFVDVSAEHSNGIISKLNRARIKGNKLKVKVA